MNKNFKIPLVTATAAMLLLTGCKTTLTDLVEVRTLDDNGNVVAVNGEPIQTAESTQDTQQTLVVEKQEANTVRSDAKTTITEQGPRYNEYTIMSEYELNVDLVARAIQRQFNFQSPQQIERQNGELAADFMIRDNAYRWDTSPGSYYNFRRSFAIKGLGYNIDFEIVKLGDDKANVITTYWVRNDNNHNRNDVKEYIRSNMRTALNRYL